MANDTALYKKAMKAGLAYNKKQQWQQAMRAFSIAINEFPRQAAPYVGLAEACVGLKQYDKALDCYKRAARYSEGNIGYIKKVADMQERQGQLSAAGQTYLAAGELLLRQNQLEAAIANWERAIRLEPGLLNAHKRLAMVFQRQGQTSAAVREYLAIARILDEQGEKKKALYMCKAALRLDANNEDVRKAVELIRHGEDLFKDEEEQEDEVVVADEGPARQENELAQTVRQIATLFESEQPQQPVAPSTTASSDAVQEARQRAEDELAEEIFREEEEEGDYSPGESGLSKLERDALIGQAIDFQSRGQPGQAIQCYERAIAGGLSLAAAYFTLGLLYLDTGNAQKAKRTLAVAAKEPDYQKAARLVLKQTASSS